MSGSIEWNLKIALNLTDSLRKFVSIRCSNTPCSYADESFNNLEKNCKQHQDRQGDSFKDLEKILNQTGWNIFSLENLQEWDRILTANNEILIIKGSEDNISAIVKESHYVYFLVAALTCNGKVLYHIKDWTWHKMNPNIYAEKPNEAYYFYYCKVTSKSLLKFLRMQEAFNGHPYLFKKLQFIWHSTQNSLKIFENDELSIRDRHEEEMKNEIIRENKESIEKINKEKEEDKARILILETKIKELELQNEKNYQKIIDLQNEKEKLEAEISSLKIYLSEKKFPTQSIINYHEILENNKNLENINDINYWPGYYSGGNEIIKLPPNRKHGLPNFGNTCYLNSLLQIFASTPLFENKIEIISSEFCSSLSSLLFSMNNESSSNAIKDLTRNFYQKLIETYSNIKQYSQQDVKEIFSMILGKIEEDGGNLDIFSIVFHQIFNCCRNHWHQSEYKDIKTFLIIPPQYKDSINSYIQNQICSSLSTQSLFCNNCSEIVDTYISIKSTDWPIYLILYFPNPPHSIDESIYINDKNNYELYGAICYYQDEGSSHYTAFTKDGNKWNEYNDARVETKVLKAQFINLAFYSKKTDPFTYKSYNY